MLRGGAKGDALNRRLASNCACVCVCATSKAVNHSRGGAGIAPRAHSSASPAGAAQRSHSEGRQTRSAHTMADICAQRATSQLLRAATVGSAEQGRRGRPASRNNFLTWPPPPLGLQSANWRADCSAQRAPTLTVTLLLPSVCIRLARVAQFVLRDDLSWRRSALPNVTQRNPLERLGAPPPGRVGCANSAAVAALRLDFAKTAPGNQVEREK